MSDAATDDAPAQKGRKKLLIVVAAALVVVLGALVVVGYMFITKADADTNAAPEPGVVVPLEDEMTLNLADGKFLKVQLALELTKEASEAAGEKAATTFDGSKAQDSAIAVLSTYTYKDLLDAKTKEAARKKLSDEVRARYDGAVMQVYFKQFVMQ